VQYKGDDYEKVLINAFEAINYLELGNLDEALVEVRRLNNKLYKFKFEGKKNYEQNAFAFYLSGVIWEADQKWDDAYIAYKHAYEINPNFPSLKEDLIRAAKQAQRPEDYRMWREKFPEAERTQTRKRDQGELIIVYQQGWGPRKKPRPEMPRLPMLVPVNSNTVQSEVVVTPIDPKSDFALKEPLRTERIHSIEDVAIKTFEDQYAALVAKRVGGIVAKEVIADQVRQKNELLGLVVWAALHATDRADLRQWSSLPESLQLARLSLPPGKYRVQVRGIGSNQQYTGEDSDEREIEILPRKKSFMSWRSTQ